MAVHTLTEQLDDLYTTTWYLMRDKIRDQIFDATPFWAWMKAKGKMATEEGGREIQEPLEYAKNDLISWIGKGGTVSLNDYEHLTVARFNWHYLVASMVRFGVDDHQNRGKARIINRMEAKMRNTRMSLEDTLESALFSTAGSVGGAIDGLQALVPNSATAASYGGIDPNTYTWWQNKTTNMTGESFSTYGVDRMRTMLNNTMQNKASDAPDLIMTTQTIYEYYESNTLEHYRIQSNEMADLGFKNQTFKGIPMVWAPSCQSQAMYFLNTEFLHLKYDPMLNFAMTEWKPIPDQVNDRAAQIILACSLTCSRRRCQGVIHTIDTE